MRPTTGVQVYGGGGLRRQQGAAPTQILDSTVMLLQSHARSLEVESDVLGREARGHAPVDSEKKYRTRLQELQSNQHPLCAKLSSRAVTHTSGSRCK